MSHIPNREAVRTLETESLIVALPQRAAVAAGVDLNDLGARRDLDRSELGVREAFTPTNAAVAG